MPKPSRPLLHEWMHRFQVPGYTVRVWCARDASDASGIEYRAQQLALNRVFSICCEPNSRETLFESMAELPFVNAVEAVNADGNGRLVYVDWP